MTKLFTFDYFNHNIEKMEYDVLKVIKNISQLRWLTEDEYVDYLQVFLS